jgi:hypothetical protein
VDQSGLYRLGFRFVDVSTNRPGGGPIQAPSNRLHLYFQADVTFAGISTSTNGITMTFAALSNVSDEDPTASPTRYQIESTPTLGPSANWQSAGDIVVGDDHMHAITLPMGGRSAFFRLNTH